MICGTSDGNIYGVTIGGITLFHMYVHNVNIGNENKFLKEKYISIDIRTVEASDVSHVGRTFMGIENVADEFYLQGFNGKLHR